MAWASMLCVAALATPGGGTPTNLVSLTDPAGDDNGPGHYVAPSGADYRSGDFDLRQFRVRLDGDQVVFLVTVGTAVREPDTTRRTNRSPLDLSAGIFVQNVDIYIDSDPQAGFVEALPGRRIRFAPEAAWDVAVVLTPQPYRTRALVSEAMGAAAGKVHFVPSVRAQGRTIIARVPLAVLGDVPRPSWGYAVLLTGAVWDPSFDVADRLTGTREIDGFTMPVLGVAERRAFGGAGLDRFHAQVIDLFAPRGTTQQQILGGYDVAAQRLAVVPMVYPNPEARRRVLGPEDAASQGGSDEEHRL